MVTVDPNSYLIGPQDSIAINVFEEDKFTGPATVRPDGMITIPLIGDVLAAGRTPMQLAADITVKLKKLVTDPAVTVSVTGVNSKYVTFVGGIGKQGQQPITPGMTILQAIANAGGLSAYANPKKIYIQRRSPQGKEQIIHFDYKKALKTGNMQGVDLVPGDTIVVPE
jgi:polysaccharide export outer membrane protein